MRNYCVIDIETEPLPLAELEKLMPEFEAPDNLKDPVKIEAAIAQKKLDWLDKAALSPLTGRICAIGYHPGEADIETTINYTEKELLQNFWQRFDTDPDMTWIGHNLHGFDLPFIVKRSLHHWIRVPMNYLFNHYRYPADQFVDTMKVFTCGVKPRGGKQQKGDPHNDNLSLDVLGKFLGLEGKSDDCGKDFGKILKEDPKRAIGYLKGDLELTFRIAKRLTIIP